MDVTVLLIGSTGNGKSALGNFLFDPRFDNKEHFKVGRDNLPKTQTCKPVTCDVKYRRGRDEKYGILTIIDTPGINENEEKDLEHMTDLVTTLKKQQSFKVCIFVVNFSAKIDQQYKDTIKYYAKLLPSLFSKNCIIAMTHYSYATDKRSEALRERISFDTIVKNIQEEIEKYSSNPMMFAIDSIPYDEEEAEWSKQVRDSMLSYIFSLREVNVAEPCVSKTMFLQSEDVNEARFHHYSDNGKVPARCAMAASAVLMIGSSGSGKSALGNFLFDPRFANKECFEVATDNRPKTQTCQAVTGPVKYRQGQGSSDTFDGTSEDSLGAQSSSGTATGFVKDTINKFSKLTIGAKNEMSGSLTVIDTPGIKNEGRKEDLEHMTGLVTTLKEQEVFKACIFVVKFSAKIDQQYKDTIMFYAKLLPDLFSHNCLIVMTEYATDKRSEKLRRRKGGHYDTIVRNVKEEIIKSSGICFTPIIFAIDSIPYEEDEVEQSKRVRDVIISYIFSLREVRITRFLVPKTRILQDEDRKVISSLNGEIQGYKERLQQMNASAKKTSIYELHKAKHAEEERRKRYIELESEISHLKKCIQENGELIELLSLDTMTLEQAKARLKRLK